MSALDDILNRVDFSGKEHLVRDESGLPVVVDDEPDMHPLPWDAQVIPGGGHGQLPNQ